MVESGTTEKREMAGTLRGLSLRFLDLHAMWSGRKLMISGPAAGEFVFEMEEVKRSFSRGALDGVTVLTHGEHRFKLTSVQ